MPPVFQISSNPFFSFTNANDAVADTMVFAGKEFVRTYLKRSKRFNDINQIEKFNESNFISNAKHY